MLSFIAHKKKQDTYTHSHIHTVSMDGLSGRMHRNLAILLVSGQRDWETSVGRKLKIHCMLYFTFRKEVHFALTVVIFQKKNYAEFS